MYKLTGVTKDYQKGRTPVLALQGVDVVIEDGEWLAIQGPTGHGKSTLLQMLGGLDRPTSGTVEFDGQDLAEMRESQVTRVRATSIGFIFQTFNLMPTLSAQENVETALVPLHVSAGERQARARQALEDVGLGDRLRHLPAELSGGQQQRVAIARALVKEPKVLLADEPTGNLDEGTRDEIIGLLERLWRDRDLTLVLVTHDSSIARRAQRVGVMQGGKLSIKQDIRHAAEVSGAGQRQLAPDDLARRRPPGAPALRRSGSRPAGHGRARRPSPGCRSLGSAAESSSTSQTSPPSRTSAEADLALGIPDRVGHQLGDEPARRAGISSARPQRRSGRRISDRARRAAVSFGAQVPGDVPVRPGACAAGRSGCAMSSRWWSA